MQDRFVAHIGDYAKYALLRAVTGAGIWALLGISIPTGERAAISPIISPDRMYGAQLTVS